MKTCLKYHGGKSYLAKKIVELMPGHTHYLEPYFGGGSVLFAKDPDGISETVNDLDGELTNFWWTLQTEFEEFKRLCEATPFSEVEWDIVNDPLYEPLDPVEQAWAFFVKNRMSRQGLMKDYATPTRRTRRGMNESVSAWLTAVDGLGDFHARVRRVEIRNMEATDFIEKYDHKNALFYCDPPYTHETRSAIDAYKYEMSVEQHKKLLGTLGKIEGKMILSSYHSDLYSKEAQVYGWRCERVMIDNKASSSKIKERKVECLWMNYD